MLVFWQDAPTYPLTATKRELPNSDKGNSGKICCLLVSVVLFCPLNIYGYLSESDRPS